MTFRRFWVKELRYSETKKLKCATSIVARVRTPTMHIFGTFYGYYYASFRGISWVSH